MSRPCGRGAAALGRGPPVCCWETGAETSRIAGVPAGRGAADDWEAAWGGAGGRIAGTVPPFGIIVAAVDPGGGGGATGRGSAGTGGAGVRGGAGVGDACNGGTPRTGVTGADDEFGGASAGTPRTGVGGAMTRGVAGPFSGATPRGGVGIAEAGRGAAAGGRGISPVEIFADWDAADAGGPGMVWIRSVGRFSSLKICAGGGAAAAFFAFRAWRSEMSVPGEEGTGSACSFSRFRAASRSAGDLSASVSRLQSGMELSRFVGAGPTRAGLRSLRPLRARSSRLVAPPPRPMDPTFGPPPAAGVCAGDCSGVCLDSTAETGPRFSACATISPRSLSISISACRVRNSASAPWKSLPLWKRAAGSFASARARIGLNSAGIAAS